MALELELGPGPEAGGGRANESNGLRKRATAIIDKRILNEKRRVYCSNIGEEEWLQEEMDEFRKREWESQRSLKEISSKYEDFVSIRSIYV